MRQIAREKANSIKQQGKASTDNTAKYRDRASERRVLHHQPDAPIAERIAAQQPDDGLSSLPSRSPPPSALLPAKDENNMGNKLLKMMGWTEGTGLGSEGEGRVDPIKTAMYASGAGLGASKGKEVGKYTDQNGYANLAKDSVLYYCNDLWTVLTQQTGPRKIWELTSIVYGFHCSYKTFTKSVVAQLIV